MVGEGGGHAATMSNLNPSYLECLWVELSWVELGLGFDNNIKVIGPEEMPILVWGRRKRPTTKMGST